MATGKYQVVHIGPQRHINLEDERRELERVGATLEVTPRFQKEEEVIACARDADGLIITSAPLTQRVLGELHRCRVVVRTGVGVDTVDVPAATELGIAVVNVPDLWTREVANHALMLLLACCRKLLALDGGVRGDRWREALTPPVGSLHGETLGIVGLGRIGRAVARRAHAFDLRLLACDPYIGLEVFQEYNATPVPLERLLREADYVSLHVPLTAETSHLLGQRELRSMKPTACVINTSRGPVVHEVALIKALREGWIAGAGLDVLEQEPPDPENPLLHLPNVVLTPHAAYYSDTAVAGLPRRCGQEVARVLTGRMPLNLVNPEVAPRLGLRAGEG
ncbi:MAG: C-terminal binding protein [Chloroflexi bacterium]|nr:C-terminal binding protein [Chloroflexota bacterium]